MLDFELEASYVVLVRVTDTGTPSALAASSTVVISIIDQNDSPFMPVLTVSMDEDSTAGTVVPSSTLLGIDEDSTDNSVANPLLYTMVAHSGPTGAADFVAGYDKHMTLAGAKWLPLVSG